MRETMVILRAREAAKPHVTVISKNGKCEIAATITKAEFLEYKKLVDEREELRKMLGPWFPIGQVNHRKREEWWDRMSEKYHFERHLTQHHVNPETHEIHEGYMGQEEAEDLKRKGLW